MSDTEYVFLECPRCAGYGVRDNGMNCTNCGGSGAGGLDSRDGVIGSGDIILERGSGRVIPYAEFAARMTRPKPGLPESD